MKQTPKTTTQKRSAQSDTARPAARQSSDTSNDTSATVEKQRRIQREQDTQDAKKAAGKPAKPAAKKAEAKPTPQTNRGKPQPAPPLAAQHLEKPGLEADMALRPRFEAPDYKGSGKLQGFSAVAVLFAREGANVAIVYLSEDADAEETKAHIEAEGGQCLLIPGDVKDAAFCQAAVAQTVEAFGGLDVLVNNAAFQEHAESIEDLSEERFDETLRTNVYGYFHMAKAAVPHLKAGGSIINTGSVTGLNGSKDLLDYSTTKGAIHAFTKALASSLISKGIRVNAVAPGPVWTPLNPADKEPEKVAEFGAKTDFGRPAQPEELSPAYVFLAAPSCSSFITGIVLPITGTAGDGA
jgi:NAD(P)-dependent dehydrogenase (short-subunit alcohol dehydrogenase family)